MKMWSKIKDYCAAHGLVIKTAGTLSPNVKAEVLNHIKKEESVSDSLIDFKCRAWPTVGVWEQPNIRKLYDILLNDDVQALAEQIDNVNNQIGAKATRLLWVELRAGDDIPVFNNTDSRSSVRSDEWQYKTDWFSAAVYMNATNCIEFALKKGWGGPLREIANFNDNGKRIHDDGEKTTDENLYRYGMQSVDGSLRQLCFSGESDFDWVDSAKENGKEWSKIDWCPNVTVGSIEWLKRIVFEMHYAECSEVAFLKWCKDECPRSILQEEPGAYYGETADTCVISEKTLLRFVELGWCNVKTIEELKSWFEFNDIDQNDNYKDPISKIAYENRTARKPLPLDFIVVLERLKLLELIPSDEDGAVRKNSKQVL